jgi:hypothetical protein
MIGLFKENSGKTNFFRCPYLQAKIKELLKPPLVYCNIKLFLLQVYAHVCTHAHVVCYRPGAAACAVPAFPCVSGCKFQMKVKVFYSHALKY